MKRHLASEDMLEEIARLEAQHKVMQSEELKQELEAKVSKLKLIGATCVA